MNRLERTGLALFVLAILAFGVVVEIRAAFQKMRRTDFGVYARAAWAVRTGEDLYQIADDRGWHYCYPPLFAALMTPLADPPADAPRFGYLPFPVSVAIWYFFSLACVAWSVNQVARVLLPYEPDGTRRWWYARTAPIYLAIGGIGFTLARGQVNTVVIALILGMFVASARGLRFQAGIWLAAAASLKVIPLYLSLWLLMVAGKRGIAGLMVGLALFLFVIPSAIWGPTQTLEMNQTMLASVLQPGATGTGDQTRSKELTNSTATDSQSFQAAIHNLRYPSPLTRPNSVDGSTRLAHWAIGITLTLILFGVTYERYRSGSLQDPAQQLILLGLYMLVMLHVTPVSHMHYYSLGIVAVMGVWYHSILRRSDAWFADGTALLVLVGWCLSTAIPLFQGEIVDRLREVGFGILASLALGLFAIRRLYVQKPGSTKEETRSQGWFRVFSRAIFPANA